MDFTLQQIKHVLRLHDLIKRKATGDPQSFADRMGFSRATLFRHLDGLRSLDAEIDYDKDRQSYFYKNPPNFSELKKILASLDD
jgi:predicted DNA-binding transcriptional regulator YafY